MLINLLVFKINLMRHSQHFDDCLVSISHLLTHLRTYSLTHSITFVGVWKTYLDMRKNVDLNLNSKQSSEITSVKLSSTIEPGTILISHPLVYGVLHRSVILVIESNDKGSYGLIINKFTDNTVNDSVRNLPDKVHRG